ncbi:hypothetical protein FHS57_001805 [Runella defluvii]|uniref:Outer membrane protein beta-barrel domain-containing protein n=1 Tax=Runella defluvii TaxID=370973 RepID=A0A7W6EPT3_9BACT|nr:hypothetical protein [Runella defluvii]MBB3837808.1 hypothetical protein [Runella defluvii]
MIRSGFLGFFLVAICISTGFAQDYDRFTLNIAAGKSLSVRELATKVFGETRGEIAGDGIGAQFVASYYPTKRLGLAARVSYNKNETREEGIQKIALNQYGILNPVVVEAKEWDVLSAMIGPTLRLGGSRLGLEGRLLVGYAKVNSPMFVTTGAFQNYNINVETSSQMASDLAYGAGATFHIGLFSGVALVVNADASLISTTFKGVNNKVTTTGFPSVTQSVDIQQNVGVVNVTGGLRFAF